jgi:pyruvate formate lyase activating enzyme
METCGFASPDRYRRIQPLVDLFLFDYKLTDPALHKQYIGQDNTLILENAKRIAKEARRLIIRTPVVPGFNDTEDEIRAIARFAKSLDGVREMHLLPYHRIGSDKYAGLGRHYTMDGVMPPKKEWMQVLLEVVRAEGLDAQIGG